jgi:hypothetical protein
VAPALTLERCRDFANFFHNMSARTSGTDEFVDAGLLCGQLYSWYS